jgi:tetratricopeptide (TPR) repeat protein
LDGARFVWAMHERIGLRYEYVPARSLRASPHFRVVPAADRRIGDVAWWPTRVAVAFPDGTVRTPNRPPERLEAVEATLGPVTYLRYVADPPRRTRRVDFRRFGARVLATAPDAYVWNEARQLEQPRLAFLQIRRRDLRQPDGSDADASFGLTLERLEPGTKARAYAEALRGRALARGAKLTEEGGLFFLRKDCDQRPCRIEVTVRVDGETGLQTLCVYHRAIEGAVKPDCAAWLRSVELGRAAPPAVEQPAPPVVRGGRRLDDGDPAGALDEFRAARKANPADALAWSEEAAAFAAMHEWPDCVTAATEALRLQPDRVEALATRGACLGHLSRLEEALADLDAALERSPSVEAYVGRALLRAEAGNLEGARADALQVGRLDPALVPRVAKLIADD